MADENTATSPTGLKFGKAGAATNAEVAAGIGEAAGLNPAPEKAADVALEPTMGKVDVEGLRGHRELEPESAKALDAEGDAPEPAGVKYTSHPIANYSMGKYQFTQGTMTLPADEAAEFDKLLAEQPIYVRNQVKKLDLDEANAKAAAFAQSRMSRGIDTAGTKG